jgi:peroxiredoxin
VRLFAVSRDSPYSHKRYAEQQWLTYPLLSDWTAAAVRAPVRISFLVDGDGVIRGTWRYGDDEVPDVDELLTAAHAL